MKFKFKPEMFEPTKEAERMSWLEGAAHLANAALDEHLKRLTRVYGCIPPGESTLYYQAKKIEMDTHTALLWDLEEIKPKKCAQ